MKVIQVKRYVCDHCGIGRAHQQTMLNHEEHCFKNPQRTPMEGEPFNPRWFSHDFMDSLPEPAWQPDVIDFVVYLEGAWRPTRESLPDEVKHRRECKPYMWFLVDGYAQLLPGPEDDLF